MSIDRREFVASLGLGILAFACGELSELLQDATDYSFGAVGFSLTRPQAWRLVSASEIDLLRSEARLPKGEQAKKAVLEDAGDLILLLTRYPAPRRGPTLAVWRQPAEASDHSSDDNTNFARVHDLTYSLASAHFRDVTFLERALPARFASRPASRCSLEFGEDNGKGESWETRLVSHMLRWGQSWLTFNFMDLRERWSPASMGTLSTIEASIRFFPPTGQAA